MSTDNCVTVTSDTEDSFRTWQDALERFGFGELVNG